MSSNGHITHNAVTFGLGCACASVAIATRTPAWVAVSVGAFSGLMLTPDLDLERGCVATKTFALWRLIWRPYAHIIPHRSFWSHTPIVGTAVRLLYLAALLAIPAIWFYPHLPGPIVWAAVLIRSFGMYAFAGLCTADILHWVMDR